MPASDLVRGHQKVHRRPHHQNELQRRVAGKRKDLSQQTKHDPGPGKRELFFFE